MIEHLPYSREMSLKIGLKIVLHVTGDLEASQGVRSLSPSRTRHVGFPSLDREGQEPLRAPVFHHLAELSLVFGKKTQTTSQSFTGFMMLVLNVLVEKLSSTLLVSKEKVGLASIFVTSHKIYVNIYLELPWKA